VASAKLAEVDVLLRMSGICKRFGAVAANADVDLQVLAGTVHVIVG
jgi:simple sugar transport system ATP-binding protein